MEDRRRLGVILAVAGVIVVALAAWIVIGAATTDDGVNGDRVGDVRDMDPLPAEQPGQGDIDSPAQAPGMADDPAFAGSCEPGEAIAWDLAPENVGVSHAYIGAVVEVREEDEGAVLVLGDPDQEQSDFTFNVMLRPTAVDAATEDPQEMFEEQRVCVIGVVNEVDDELQLEVNRPADIRVLEQ